MHTKCERLDISSSNRHKNNHTLIISSYNFNRFNDFYTSTSPIRIINFNASTLANVSIESHQRDTSNSTILLRRYQLPSIIIHRRGFRDRSVWNRDNWNSSRDLYPETTNRRSLFLHLILMPISSLLSS